jgi:hypothetical protein
MILVGTFDDVKMRNTHGGLRSLVPPTRHPAQQEPSSPAALRHHSHMQIGKHQILIARYKQSPLPNSRPNAHIFLNKHFIVSKKLSYPPFRMAAFLSSVLAPIALPLGSFLAIPMFSSWSTGLNLIFLSVAWTTIAASYSPLQLELVAPLVLRLSLYIIPSLIFLLFDIGLPSLAVEFKTQGKWGIPSNQKGGVRTVRRVVAWSCANVLLMVALQAGIEFLVTDILQMKSLLFIKGSRWGLNHLPNPWTMVKHGAIGFVSRNVSSLFHVLQVCPY